MALIRVLLAAPSALADRLGQGLSQTDDMEIVGSARGPVETLLAVKALQAEVVMVAMGGEEVPGIASHLVAEYPDVKVLAVSSDARRAVLYQLQPRLIRLNEASPGDLLRAVRSAVRPQVPE